MPRNTQEQDWYTETTGGADTHPSGWRRVTDAVELERIREQEAASRTETSQDAYSTVFDEQIATAASNLSNSIDEQVMRDILDEAAVPVEEQAEEVATRINPSTMWSMPPDYTASFLGTPSGGNFGGKKISDEEKGPLREKIKNLGMGG